MRTKTVRNRVAGDGARRIAERESHLKFLAAKEDAEREMLDALWSLKIDDEISWGESVRERREEEKRVERLEEAKASEAVVRLKWEELIDALTDDEREELERSW